jgi:hypothetical protein
MLIITFITIESIAKSATEYTLKYVKDIPLFPINNDLSGDAQERLMRRLENCREAAQEKCNAKFYVPVKSSHWLFF